jgi:ribonucleoside-diphosphate reductase beta chain
VAGWPELSEEQRDFILRLLALFVGGEESVVGDLLPVLSAIGSEGRLEEQLYLTAFLWEEGKHVEFFCRYLDEVVGEAGDLTRFHGPMYRLLVYRELPDAMGALSKDTRPEVQARAAVTYMMIVEGVLAETAYEVLIGALDDEGALPGLSAGLKALKRDESRHLAFGLYWLGRLVRSHPEVWDAVDTRFRELTPIAIGVATESVGSHQSTPFGVGRRKITAPAAEQIKRRRAYLERIHSGQEPPPPDLDNSRGIG